NDCRANGGTSPGTAATENSPDYRSAGRAFDAGSPSDAVAPNPEAHGVHRGYGRGTGQGDLAQTPTLRRRSPTGVFCAGDWTRCRGEHFGRNWTGHERGWSVFGLSSVSLLGGNLPR